MAATRREALTDAEKVRICELREKRLSEATIARLLKRSKGSVSWALLGLGVDIHPLRPLAPVPETPVIHMRPSGPVRRFTQEEDQQLLDLEASGLALFAIGKRLGRPANSITGRLRTLARRQERELAQQASA